MKKTVMAVTLAGAVGLAGVFVPRIAAPQEANGADAGGADAGDCWGNGPGRRGGWGPGMGGGHGPGMMGGRGYGGGAHGWGGGPGAMGRGLGPIWRLDLSDEQRAQVNKIVDDARHDNWATLGKLQDAGAKLRELQDQDQPDPKKVGAAFAEVSKLRQDLVEANVKTRNQVRAVLTAEQRKELGQWRSRGFGPRARRWSGGARQGMADPQR